MTSDGNSDDTATSATETNWDLTGRIAPYLDRHMVFPLLEFIEPQYSTQDIATARLALLRPTHMVDYAMDTYKSVHGGAGENDDNVPAEMVQQKESVFQARNDLKQRCEPLETLLQSAEEVEKLVASGQFNVAGVQQQNADITLEVVEAYRQLARFQFDCGDYKAARDMLQFYIQLHAKPPVNAEEGDEDMIAAGLNEKPNASGGGKSSNETTGNPAMYYLPDMNEKMLQVLWGRLASEILVQDWPAAAVAVEAVKTALEGLASASVLSALQALKQRTWLMHWSLFVYWNDDSGASLERLVDLFFSERYKQAITTHAPHLLRYLTAAVLLCKRRLVKKSSSSGSSSTDARRLLKSLIYVMQDCEYTDPIVEFVNCLCVKFDFDMAQQKLAECNKVLTTDFFLKNQTDLFMEEARVFVFENYCRIHHKIDLVTLGDKLAMDQDATERWIVDLIRKANLDAKIDYSADPCVVMGSPQVSVYEQVVDRTRDLNVRSATLQQNLYALLQENRKEKARKAALAREEEY